MHWIEIPFIDLAYIAGQLYGSRSRLHTRRLQDRLAGKVAFQEWEKRDLEESRKQVLRHLIH